MDTNLSQISQNERHCYLQNETLIHTRGAIVFCVANSLFSLMAISGNLLIMTAVCKTAMLQTPTNFLISSMSFADFLVGLVAIPLWITRAKLNITDNTHVLCIISDFITIQSLMASTYGLCGVTVDRYVAITLPYKYVNIITPNRCFTAILIAWAFTTTLASFRFLVNTRSELPKFYVSAAIFGIILPIVVICFCYTRIFKAAQAQRRKINSFRTSLQVADSLKQRKTAYTIAIIVGLYVIFWSPTFTVSFLDFTLPMCFYDAWLATVSISLANSAVNPWIYAVRNKQFWRPFKRPLWPDHNETSICKSNANTRVNIQFPKLHDKRKRTRVQNMSKL